MVIIKKFESKITKEFMNLEISPDQNDFVHFDLDEIIKSSQIYKDRYLYTIFNQLELVGFAYFQMFDEHMYLLKFMIDSKYQRMGYAKDALPRLMKLIKPSLINEELWLSVHPKNSVAINLYKDIGFLQEITPYDADDEIFFKYQYLERSDI